MHKTKHLNENQVEEPSKNDKIIKNRKLISLLWRAMCDCLWASYSQVIEIFNTKSVENREKCLDIHIQMYLYVYMNPFDGVVSS